MKAFLIPAALLLTACTDTPRGCRYVTDQRVRHILTVECMDPQARLPLATCLENAVYRSRYLLCQGDERRPDVTTEWLLSLNQEEDDE